ncbi:MAG: hypothetical protein HQK49_03955 [Oligoflexia bacterium]|nr:hypothetical protein [Oligoflexia bacterium]
MKRKFIVKIVLSIIFSLIAVSCLFASCLFASDNENFKASCKNKKSKWCIDPVPDHVVTEHVIKYLDNSLDTKKRLNAKESLENTKTLSSIFKTSFEMASIVLRYMDINNKPIVKNKSQSLPFLANNYYYHYLSKIPEVKKNGFRTKNGKFKYTPIIIGNEDKNEDSLKIPKIYQEVLGKYAWRIDGLYIDLNLINKIFGKNTAFILGDRIQDKQGVDLQLSRQDASKYCEKLNNVDSSISCELLDLKKYTNLTSDMTYEKDKKVFIETFIPNLSDDDNSNRCDYEWTSTRRLCPISAHACIPIPYWSGFNDFFLLRIYKGSINSTFTYQEYKTAFRCACKVLTKF